MKTSHVGTLMSIEDCLSRVYDDSSMEEIDLDSSTQLEINLDVKYAFSIFYILQGS
jgi:hypothetical protein